MLGAHKQSAGRVDPLEDAFAFASAILDRDPFAKAKRVIEPGGANTVERLSGPPDVERFSKALNETLKQFIWSNRCPARPRQT